MGFVKCIYIPRIAANIEVVLHNLMLTSWLAYPQQAYQRHMLNDLTFWFYVLDLMYLKHLKAYEHNSYNLICFKFLFCVTDCIIDASNQNP